jgi:hypothetical protein
MSCWISLESLSVAMRVCSCRDVYHSCLKPSWLFCKIWYFSPQLANWAVMVLVKSLYIVFARAIGLWFVRIDGSDFLYKRMVRLVFHEVGICCCL